MKRLVLVLFASALLSVLFGNCGPGFQVQDFSSHGNSGSGSSGQSGSDPEPASGDIAGGFKFHYLAVSSDLACNPSDPGLANKGIRRLSGQELRNSLLVLFGQAAMSNATVVTSLDLLPKERNNGIVEGWNNNIESVEALLEVARALADYVFANSSRLEPILPGCFAAPSGAACRTSMSDFAKKVYRRPFTQAEQTSLETFVSGYSDLLEGRKHAVMRLILSPYFHQHMEVTDSSRDKGRIRLSAYEVASRLAFKLTGFPPDAALMAAAEQGQLETLEQVTQQARRLVDTANARAKFKQFLSFWLKTETNVDPHPTMQAALGINPSGMTAEMKQEFDRWVDYIVFERGGDFQDLIKGNVMFPSTTRLARLMETTLSGQPVPAPPERSGILFRPLVMNIGQANSNPIARGVLLRRQLLCLNLPPPSAQIVNSRLTGVGELSVLEHSTRDIVNQITNSPSCLGCHQQINSIGFAFENFGPFGDYRNREQVFDLSGNKVAEHVVDASVSQVPLPGRTPVSVSSSIELVSELAVTPSLMRCFAQQMHRFSSIRDAQTEDGCSLNSAAKLLQDGASVKESIVNTVANDAIFWRQVVQ